MDRRDTAFAYVALLAATSIAIQGCEKQPNTPTAHPLTAELRSASSVTAYRVDTQVREDKSRAYIARHDGKKIGQQEQVRLADALGKVDFGPGGLKACEFEPGVEYRFMKGGDEIALQVCFHCNDLMFLGPTEKYLRTVDFSYVKAEFREIAKAVFPGDPEIQALK